MPDPRDRRAANTLVTLGLSPDAEAILHALDNGTWSEALATMGLDGDRAAEALAVVELARAPLGDDTVTPGVPGRYDHARELGEGGMGRVTLATDGHLHRNVAMKELLVQHPAMELRFLREARLTAQLEHPGIVPVYELGRRGDGTLYYTMKEVRGHTLRDALQATARLDERLALLGVLVDVCQAVGYAHSKGVVHRDLKPENVMIGAFGETTVLDWGLAKVAGEPDVGLPSGVTVGSGTGSDLTRAGTVMGTPKYMSPEQAAGRLEAVDARSDVWALGVVLYEILTGDVPFDGTSASVLQQVQQGAWVPPDSLVRDAPAALVAICTKALERDPDDRYADAAGIAADLEAWRTGASVGAHTYGAVERVQRAAGRFRAVLVAVAALALGAGGAFLAQQARVDGLSADLAASREAAGHLARLLDADTLARNGDPARGLALARAALAAPGAHQAQAEALAEALAADGDARVLTEAPARLLAWTPSGTRLAWVEGEAVVIADPASGGELGRIEAGAPVDAYAFTPTEGSLWIAAAGELRGVGMNDLKETGRFTVGAVEALRAGPDGLDVRVAGAWTGRTWKGEPRTPDVAAPTEDPSRWDAVARTVVAPGAGPFPLPWEPTDVHTSPSGRSVAAGGAGGVWLWSLVDRSGRLSNLRVCPDGRVVPVLPYPRADQISPPLRACPAPGSPGR